MTRTMSQNELRLHFYRSVINYITVYSVWRADIPQYSTVQYRKEMEKGKNYRDESYIILYQAEKLCRSFI